MIPPVVTGAWTLVVTDWCDGVVGLLTVTATHKGGAVAALTVFRFPAGWRCGAQAGVPRSVTAAALRLARQTGL